MPIRVWLVLPRGGFRARCLRRIREAADLVCTACFPDVKSALGPDPGSSRRQDLHPPNVLVLGLERADTDIAGVVELTRGQCPDSRVVVVADAADAAMVSRAFLAGAEGYLLKSAGVHDLLEGIRGVYRGEACMSSQVARLAVDLIRNGLPAEAAHEYRLTLREVLHLQLLVRGMSKKQVASELCISFHTVDTHLRSIYRKLGVNTRSAAVAKAIRERLLQAQPGR